MTIQWLFLLPQMLAVPDYLLHPELLISLLILLLVLFLVIAVFILLLQDAKRKQEELKRSNSLLTIDETTDLLNERSFEAVAQNRLRHHSNRRWFLLDFDINHFESINTLYGFQRGNDILQAIAAHLRRERDQSGECFARVYADHFICLLTSENLSAVKRRVLAMDEKLRNLPVHPGLQLSYGLYPVTDTKLPVTQLCDYALTAKRLVKGNCMNPLGIYDADFHQLQLERFALTAAMEPALDAGEFMVCYQPKYDIATETMIGAEALVRWQRKNGTVISPDSFITLFEQNGLITKLDFYMLETVCRFLRTALENKVEAVPVSVNFSRNHLYEADFTQRLLTMLKKYEIPPHLIEIELTESAFVNCKDNLLQVMEELHDNGLLISIDDFGSGYSSLNMLMEMPFDIVKLDRGFLNSSDRDHVVVETILDMTRRLRLKTVAEGVETKEQLAFLHENGCDIAQGYLFSQPLSEQEFSEQLMRRNRTDVCTGKEISS